jgi:superfamily II DNA/RNA helicase
VKRLGGADITAVAMHGNKSQAQRQKALARFDRGDVSTLVATDVAARGIDVEDITHVINFDVPEDADVYTHRTGRTGRAGRSGEAVSFVLADQHRDVRKLARDLGLGSEYDAHRPAGARQHTEGRSHNGNGSQQRRDGDGRRNGHGGGNRNRRRRRNRSRN